MGLSKQFRRRVASDLEMWTNTPFARLIPLGDVGALRLGGRFDTDADTTLGEKGIDIGDPLVGQFFSIAWQSIDDNSFEMAVKAEGESLPASSLPAAKAGLQIKFGKKGNYVFQAAEAWIERIPDTAEIHRKLAEARRDKRIRFNDRIVMGVLKAKRARLLMSESSEAEIELEASANFSSLVDAGLQLGVKRQKGSVANITVDGNKPTVFFMTLARVRRGGAISGLAPLHAHAPAIDEDAAPILVEVVSPLLEDPELLQAD
jgi:hypothetical protein